MRLNNISLTREEEGYSTENKDAEDKMKPLIPIDQIACYKTQGKLTPALIGISFPHSTWQYV